MAEEMGRSDVVFTANFIKAGQAQDTADTAKSTADTAKSTADTAKSTADAAKDKVDDVAEQLTAVSQTADGKNSVYEGTSIPTSGTYKTNDLFFLKDSDGVITGLYKYDGSQWVNSIDVKGINDSVTAANEAASNAKSVGDAAQTTANTAKTTAEQAASDAKDAGDTAKIAQQTADVANDKAEAAQTMANGKNTVFYGSATPSNPKSGDIWFKDNSNGTTTIEQYQDSAWTTPTDSATKAAADAASAAKSAATAAQITANGRNKIFRQAGQPTASAVGDTWFDTDNGNQVSIWDGSAWQPSKFGTAAVANLDAGAITSGTIDASKIAVKNINASNISTGTLNAARIASGSITGAKIAAGAITATNGIIASIDAGKITVGTLSANRIASKTITSDKIAIGDFTNYAAILDKKDGKTSPWWSPSSFDTSKYHTTTSSIKLPPGGSASGLKQNIAVQPGDVFYISFWVISDSNWNGSANNSKFRIGSPTSSGPILTIPYSGAKSSWTHYSQEWTVPSGVYQLQVSINNDGSTGNVWLDDIIIKRELGGSLIVDGTITASQIASGTITADKIKTGSLTSASGVFGQISANNITTGTLDASKATVKNINASNISTGTLNAARIGADSIDASKLNVSTLSAITANLGNVTAGKISGTDINIGSGKFHVDTSGNLTANSANITGTATINAGSINIGSGKFKVDSSGNLTASSASISTSGSGDTTQIEGGYISSTGSYQVPFYDPDNQFPGHADSDGNVMDTYNARFESNNGTYRAVLVDKIHPDGVHEKGSGRTFIRNLWYDNKGISTQKGVYNQTVNTGDAAGSRYIDFFAMESAGGGTTGSGMSIFSGQDVYIEGDTGIRISAPKMQVWCPMEVSGAVTSGSIQLNGGHTLQTTDNTTITVQCGTSSSGSKMQLGKDGDGNFVRSMDVYDRHYSSGANVFITDSGTIGRSTSATKYKEDIHYDLTVEDAKKILNVRPATWHDKNADEALARSIETGDESGDVPYFQRYPGFIAEDIKAAGLDQFVTYGSPDSAGNQEIEGIEYDRIPVLHNLILKDHEQEINLLKTRVTVLETILKQKGIVA